MNGRQIRALAFLGAATQAEDLAKRLGEMRQIIEQLRPKQAQKQAKAKLTRKQEVASKRRGHKMTRAQREAIGVRMRKYWASRRKAANE